jgi:YVTN family beta-propeller protein
MQTLSRTFLFLLIGSFAMTSLPAFGQRVVATIQPVDYPSAIAVNSVTNQIYVASDMDNVVTVINGATNTATTVPVGRYPHDIAVNPVTNKIYVPNVRDNTVTVIDGVTLATSTVPVGSAPAALAVNPVTNKIYVTNADDNTVTVIDGQSLSTQTVPVGEGPLAVTVNSVTNKIYVGDQRFLGTSAVSVIDGATNTVATVDLNGTADFQYGNSALILDAVTNQVYAMGYVYLFVIDGVTNIVTPVQLPVYGCSQTVAVNPVTNRIYIPVNCQNDVVVIDGSSNNIVGTVPTGTYPSELSINSVSNQIYVTNLDDSSLTVIDGATNAWTILNVGASPQVVAANPVTGLAYVGNGDSSVSVIAGALVALQFVPVTPCRLVDTRQTGNPIQGGTSQSFPVPQLGNCNIPSTAAAYSLNVTLVPPPGGTVGFLTVWPTGQDQPGSSLMNSWDGRFKANAAIVLAGANGAVSAYSSDTTNLVLDINGYFAPVSGSTLAFYSLAPCRVADTRNPNGPLGGPFLTANQERDFPVLDASSCNIPSSAAAYSLNFTVVPRNDQVWVFTAWPFGDTLPGTSTLNAPTGTVVANAAIVPAGTSGKVATLASADTDLLIDINGYFAPAGFGGLSLYPVGPCRVLDTRKVGDGAPFTGQLSPPVNVEDSVCGIPTDAEAYVFNATLLPAGGPVYYLMLWPDGGRQPNVSTLNAYDGAVTSNMAILPTINGSIDAYAAGLTQLLLDISAYFAP